MCCAADRCQQLGSGDTEVLQSTDSVVTGCRDTGVQPSLEPLIAAREANKKQAFSCSLEGKKPALISHWLSTPICILHSLFYLHYLGEVKPHRFFSPFFLFLQVSLGTDLHALGDLCGAHRPRISELRALTAMKAGSCVQGPRLRGAEPPGQPGPRRGAGTPAAAHLKLLCPRAGTPPPAVPGKGKHPSEAPGRCSPQRGARTRPAPRPSGDVPAAAARPQRAARRLMAAERKIQWQEETCNIATRGGAAERCPRQEQTQTSAPGAMQAPLPGGGALPGHTSSRSNDAGVYAQPMDRALGGVGREPRSRQEGQALLLHPL